MIPELIAVRIVIANCVVDEMDKRLLLTLQSVCNTDGIKLPWDKVGVLMGDQISDGAVIQHLAKLRQRMVNQGLDVPPPLRRGGGSIISTTTSGRASASGSVGSKKTKPKNGTGSLGRADEKDEDEEDTNINITSDSDEDFDHSKSKSMKRKSKAKGRKNRINNKNEESEEDGEDASYHIGDKRKRGNTIPTVKGRNVMKDIKANNSKTLVPGSKRAYYTRRTKTIFLAKDVDEPDDSENEYSDPDITESDESKPAQGKGQYVAAGAHFLALDEDEVEAAQEKNQYVAAGARFLALDEDEVEAVDTQLSGNKGIVILRFGNSERAKSFLKGLKPTYNEGHASDAEDANDAQTESTWTRDTDEFTEIDRADWKNPSADAGIDTGINASDVNEAVQTNNDQSVYGEIITTPSFGGTINDFSRINHTHNRGVTYDAQRDNSHFEFEDPFQQYDHFGSAYAESADQNGHFGASTELDQTGFPRSMASSNAQKAIRILPKNLAHARQMEINRGLQSMFDSSYPPSTGQHSSGIQEALGHLKPLVPHYSGHSYPDNNLLSGNLVPPLPDEIVRSQTCHDELPQNINQIPNASYEYDIKYNVPGSSYQQGHFQGNQRSLTPPLAIRVPEQANYPAPIENFSASTTNFNPTPWATSPRILNDFGALISMEEDTVNPKALQSEGFNDTEDGEVRYDDFLVPLDDFENMLNTGVSNNPFEAGF